MSTGFVMFRLGERIFAAELDDVREIVRLQGLERLPGSRPPLAGVLTLRGIPLPVLDVRAPGAPDDAGDVLVVTEGDGAVGIAVDAVAAVLHPDELPEAGTPAPRALPAYVVAVRSGSDGPVLQVDIRRLLDATASGWQQAVEPAYATQ